MTSSLMQFHLTHGSAIQLTNGQTVAVRGKETFCNGIVFSREPIPVGEKVSIQLGCSAAWNGAIRVGVTSTSPATFNQGQLPRFSFPDLAQKEGFWIRAINEDLTAQGCRMVLYITPSGQLQLVVNGQHIGALLIELPVDQDLWLLLDLYGSAERAEIVKPDDVPREILSRGPETVEVYEQACACGTQAVHRTRLMLVGQERAGKTSLKKALTGQCHNAGEESTDGIDLSASCSFNLNNPSSWKLNIKGDETARRERRMHEGLDQGLIGGLDNLEEEYNRAVALNIVQDFLAVRKKDATAKLTIKNPSPSGKSGTNASAPSTPVKTSTNKEISITSGASQPALIHKDIPEHIASLVQQMIDEKDKGLKTGTALKSNGQTVLLNIWDFAGQAVYHTTHQVFLSSRAVYCIVFNLCDDLCGKRPESSDKNAKGAAKLSVLQYMDFWMRSIHAHAAENTVNNVENTTLSPPIFIVGTHRDSLAADPETRAQLVEEKFAVIREFLVSKPYVQHVVLPFYAVENNLATGTDVQIDNLRSEIELIASKQPYIGEQLPIKWLSFEQDITAQADSGINFASYNQVHEVAVNHNITKPDEVRALLNFYHDLGMLIYYGDHLTRDCILSNTVVLNPQWLVNMFQKVTAHFPPKDQWNLLADKWTKLIDNGILEEVLLPTIWPDSIDQHAFLIGLMSKFDLICQRLPPAGQTHKYPGRSWFVPMRFSPCKDKKKVYAQTPHDAMFYIDFDGFLPEGLFHRIQTRTIRWSQEHGGRDLHLSQGIARVFVDPDHDLLVEMCAPHLHRIKVLVMHVKDKEATSAKRNSCPSPEVVAKVRNFLESCLVDLRTMWMKRLAYKMCFPCPCERVCSLHDTESCTAVECMHFLDLDECLANQTVCCEHRRVKTESFKKWFPSMTTKEFREPVITPVTIEQGFGNIERHVPNLPSWLKGAAKLLNGAPENQDWFALARLMGYKQSRIDLLNEDLNPSLALLTDWIVSSGNTTMSVDVLLHYLQQLGCTDVLDVISRAKEYELEKPQIFLSYQWDVQDEVAALRDHLERAGYSCWMDIGQMGGGDQLANKIEQGLRGSKLVIACITPKYIASHLCNRELWLADMLQKPIVPVVMEAVSWPPPGGMAVVLSQLVYINMKGVGGHGGSGIHADLMDKYSEITQRVSLHVKPDLTPCLDATVIIPTEPHHHRTDRLSDRLSGYRTSMSSLSEVDIQRYSGRHDSSLDVMLSRYGELSEVTASTNNNINNIQQAQRTHPNAVPQAHVKQCAVCIIL